MAESLGRCRFVRILYVFTGGRRQRLQRHDEGEDAPVEFLFGLPYLRECGYDVDLLELPDLNPDEEAKDYRDLYKHNLQVARRTGLTSSSHLFLGAVGRLNAADILIAGNEYVALGIAHYKAQGLVRPPMLFFVMGMIANVVKHREGDIWAGRVFKLRYRRARQCYERLVRASAAAVFLGRGEYEAAKVMFPRFISRLQYLPFGTDTAFWSPGDSKPEKEAPVLFIGNDRNRDYELIHRIAASMPDVRFRWISRRMVGRTPANVEAIRGDWKNELLSDQAIRQFVRTSAAVILPLHDSLQPSGQSVALQSMACGVPVLISHTRGFWAPESFTHGQHLWFVYDSKPEAWDSVIRMVLSDPENACAVAKRARELILREYSAGRFAEGVGRILERVVRTNT